MLKDFQDFNMKIKILGSFFFQKFFTFLSKINLNHELVLKIGTIHTESMQREEYLDFLMFMPPTC